MRKILIVLFAVIFGIPIVAGTYYWTRRATILANTIESSLHVPVSIAGIDVRSDQIVIKQLRISNFSGSIIEDAFYADAITINFNVRDLLQDPTQIQSIHFQNPRVGVEMYNPQGTKNNWQRLLGNAAENAGGGSHKYVVKKIAFTDMRVRAYNSALSDDVIEPKPIAYFELRDIASDRPVSLKALIALIARAIMQEVGGIPGLANILKDFGVNIPIDAIEKTAEPLQKLQDKQKAIEKKGQKLIDSLKKL
ncbi:MAG: hypothetical protein KDK78_12395 [Chlamydiia bacterium]|nr:hypothetical protein [Chlamydiia bacterium]